ncbi:MAG: VRR-NUC domain-containing protein [Dehalococcoidia bacterium]|nr:MAG: VRR-NUC domain-containing protein [Dehalococcoidia bacterium]
MKEEAYIQYQVVNVLSLYASRMNFVFFSVPNEGTLMASAGKDLYKVINHLKKLGMTPGVSDLIIIKDGKTHCLEIKSKTGSLSENQSIFASNAVAAGALYNYCNSFLEVMEILKKWGIIPCN